MSVNSFSIDVAEERIADLKERLSISTFPDELEDADWAYGASLKDVKRLADYWQNGFDWKVQEAKLNQLPQYRASIPVKGFDDVDLHFVHQKSGRANSIPLLFVHGWPGSFIEVTKVLPELTSPGDPSQPSFDVVAPSLANFGFSGSVSKRGFGYAQYAETFQNLMRLLGYETYVTQGGDLGFYITRAMSLLYPSSCLATHINMIRANAPSFASQPALALQHAITPYSDFEKAGTERSEWFLKEGSGYRLEQCTKPQTLGYSLADSPVGLLGWIWEKLHDWTDDYPWTDDEILTWVSIYWFSTAGPHATTRIYYESMHPPPSSPGQKLAYIDRERTMQWIGSVKIGVVHFPKELGVVPRTWVRTLGNVVFETEYDHGGHFGAWEKPELLVKDVREMFGRDGPCFEIVKQRSGYD